MLIRRLIILLLIVGCGTDPEADCDFLFFYYASRKRI